MSTADAPSGQICNLCDIYELAGAKNRAEKAFRGPEHGPGTSERLSAVSRGHGPGALGRVCVRGTVAMRGRSGLIVDCQVVHSKHSIVPSKGAASQILRHMSSRGRLRQRQFGVTGHLVTPHSSLTLSTLASRAGPCRVRCGLSVANTIHEPTTRNKLHGTFKRK